MTFDKFIKGLNILAKYMKTPDAFALSAEHDEIYVYADKEISEDDQYELEQVLDWYDNKDNQENSWMAMV